MDDGYVAVEEAPDRSEATQGECTAATGVTTRRGADLLAISLMAVFLVGALALSLMPVVTNELRTSAGLTDAQIGLLTSVFMGFYGISGISSGIGAARWGGRLLVVSCGCLVVGSLIFALSPGLGGFLVGRAIQGVGGGMVIASCGAVIAHVLPPERWGRAWGILGLGWGLGTMAALLIMPSIQSAGGYRAVFLTTAILGLMVGIAAVSQRSIRALPLHPKEAMRLRGLLGLFSGAIANRRVVLLGLANTAALAMTVGVLAWTPSLLQDAHQSSEAVAVYLLAGMGAAQLIGNPLGAVADKRWSKLAIIVGSVALMTVATALVGVVPSVALVFVMVLLNGFSLMFFFAPMLSYIPLVVAKPEQVGPATGINVAMGFVGSLVAPWIFGLLLDAGRQSSRSYLIGYLMLAGFGLAATIGLAFFKGSVKQLLRRR